MNPVHRLMLQGFGFACATCEHLQQSSLAKPACGKLACSGPLRGKNFPCRVSDIKLQYHCFVCGNIPDGCMEIEGKWIGVCEKHTEMLSTYSRAGEPPPFVKKVEIPRIE